MIAETQLRSIPCAIALDSETKCIAFNRPKQYKAFIDYRDNLQAVWGDGAMNINSVEYKYSVWHTIEGDLKEYFKSLIESDYMPNMIFRF